MVSTVDAATKTGLTSAYSLIHNHCGDSVELGYSQLHQKV